MAKIRRIKNSGTVYIAVFCSALMAPAVYGQMAQSAAQRMRAAENNLSTYVVIRNGEKKPMSLMPQMTALSVPAVSVAVIRNGKIDWARAYGVSSLHGSPTSTETLFGAASISKTVTALGVLKLVETSKIELELRQQTRIMKRADEWPLTCSISR